MQELDQLLTWWTMSIPVQNIANAGMLAQMVISAKELKPIATRVSSMFIVIATGRIIITVTKWCCTTP